MTANATSTGHTASQTLSNAAYTSNFYCADIAGNLNNTENVSFTVSVPSGTAAPSGGGGGGETSVSLSFSLDKTSFEKTIVLNRITFDNVIITNDKATPQQFTLSVGTLGDIIFLDETTFTLLAGESKKIELKIVSPEETGIFAGKLIIKGEGTTKSVNIVVNTKTEKSLFDVTMTIPKIMKVIKQGKNLDAQIDLLQMGLKEKMDVTLNYIIKDFEGNTYLKESETLAVSEQITIQKEFHSANIPTGDYVLGVEVIYPDGVAVASSQFKIEEKTGLGAKNINIIMVILALAVILVFAVVFIAIRRYRNVLNKLKKH